MKKILMLFLATILAVSLAACGDDNEGDVSAADNNSNDNTEEPDTETNDSNDNEENENEEEPANEVSDSYLDNGDHIFEIKEIEQMESQFGDGTQIIAVELTFTNNSEEATSPWMAMGIGAEQETDVTVEELYGANGMFPEDYKTDLVEMGDTNVKPGATVDAVIGFELLYPGEPVRLYDFRSFDDDGDFERIVETEG